MAGMLYLVPTPIGNLGDISVRCREILAQADFIAAEDTRVTLKLLNHLELKKPLVSYYEHNKASSGGKILDRIQAGEVCALVSDAGSPAISDPGEDLVRQCAEADIPVSAVPGPCAVITALSISGLPTGRFTFEGFLSTAKKSRNQHLEALADRDPHHGVLRSASQATGHFGGYVRRLRSGPAGSPCARELTKLHEEVIRTTLGEAAQRYRQAAPKGEFVLVLAGATPEHAPVSTLEEAAHRALTLIEEGLSRKDAARQAALETGLPKNAIYDATLS